MWILFARPIISAVQMDPVAVLSPSCAMELSIVPTDGTREAFAVCLFLRYFPFFPSFLFVFHFFANLFLH